MALPNVSDMTKMPQQGPASDPLAILEAEISRSLFTTSGEPPELPEIFDEDAYLDAFPDVLSAIRRGDVISATDHFIRYGSIENRLDSARYQRSVAAVDTDNFPANGLDAVFLTYSGRCLIIGWIDDTLAPLRQLSVLSGRDHVGAAVAFARCRRPDAEAIVKPPSGALLGFWTLLNVGHIRPGKPGLSVSLAAGRFRRTIPIEVQAVNEQRIREICLEYFASATYYGNPQVDGATQLDDGLGNAIVDLNIRVSRRIQRRGAYCKRFGPPRTRFHASIVVCLYGKPEFLFLQASFFSIGGDWDGYEFVYVVNSPEITEILLKEATLATRIYGVNITLVILSGNAGFGAANNIAVNYALSDRILICNPDVFPRAPSLGRLHAELIDSRPTQETRIFGVPLFYDDGSLMHGGMFFEIDDGVSVTQSGITRRSLVRVEHYGKGAPPDTQAFLEARPLPAVTGAFMSVDRRWFERLDGFSLEYVFGHYEDADLCLKSLAAGQNVWMQPVPLWHLEGKGSDRRLVHEGGSLVNRWHFTRTWEEMISSDVRGKHPAGLARLRRCPEEVDALLHTLPPTERDDVNAAAFKTQNS